MKKRKEYIEGFRITRDDDSLLVEATDYHAMPLRLTRKELSGLGLRLVESPKRRKKRAKKREQAQQRDA